MTTSIAPTLHDAQAAGGAHFAGDGIPLHFGDQVAEYQAALQATVLMDRSHEGRLRLEGRDRLAVPQRMSTNDLLTLKPGDGTPTIFTSPIGRVIDRVSVYNEGKTALMLAEPGRGDAVRTYLQRNIFFNDDVRLTDLAPTTRQFVLLGAAADAPLAQYADVSQLPTALHTRAVVIAGIPVTASRVKPLAGAQWSLIVPNEQAAAVWLALTDAGAIPAGSLTYNVLRIRAARPGVGRELSGDYIPLEIGLWDEVSFSKGCYTGQEIIARMESRGRLARTIVALNLSAPAEAPASLLLDGREVGTLTSAVTAPDGIHYGIGLVKVAAAQPGSTLALPNDATATITRLAGVQPAFTQE